MLFVLGNLVLVQICTRLDTRSRHEGAYILAILKPSSFTQRGQMVNELTLAISMELIK